ncbi:MAG: Gfo/Idh/MocA family oxidoreductase [Thermomicrobiales bacterium]|nr:Gfo/Idh/MocA family oxidoreductase [Thermomicrobiales bacterium]
MSDHPLRIAIVGAGGISRRHRAAILAQPESATLVSVCDARPDAAQTLASSLTDPASTFGDHRVMIDAGGFDAAIIAVPHILHFDVAKDFVEAGIPVLVEKPLTCTLDETRALRELSARNDTPVVAGQTQRFNREGFWLRNWVQQEPPGFGSLRSFDIHSWQNLPAYLQGTLGLPPGADHWLLDGQRAGGGAVISIAVHQIDLVRFITGRNYSEVMATGRYDPPFYNGAESSAVVLFRMDDGSSGALHANYLAVRTPYNEAMHLFGEHGTIVQHAERIGQYHGPLFYSSDGGEPATAWADMYQGFTTLPEDEMTGLSPDPFTNQLASFVQAIRAGTEPANTVTENFNTMACIDAIYESLRTGQPATVATA